MGNHTVGLVVGPQAELALKTRERGETALAILDRLCTPWRNTDAEWESADPANPTQVNPEYGHLTDPHPKAALGMLMVEAFAPNGLADLARYAPMLDAEGQAEESACDAWWTEVYAPFNKRYDFC
jgi:hypothetical protein